MAELDLNKIISNYQNMSMEDLGGVLLQRQSTNRKRTRKRQKREDKILKIIAALLGGQAAFEETYKNRNAELDSLHSVAKMRNAKMAAEMQIVGGVLRALPEELLMADNAYELYMEESKDGDRYQDLFRNAIYGQVLNAMKAADPDGVKLRQQGKTLKHSIYDIIDDIIAPYYLESKDGQKSRAQQLMEAGEAYFDDPNITGAEVFDAMFGISEDDVSIKRATRLQNRKSKIAGETGWFNVPGLLGKVFKGEPTIFRKITAAETTELQTFLEKDIEIGKFLTPYFSETMASWDNNVDYYSQGLGDPKLLSRETGSMQDTSLRQFIYQGHREIENYNAGMKKRLSDQFQDGGKEFERLRDIKLDTLEEAEYVLRGLYGSAEERNKLDERFGNDVSKTWAALRGVIDDTDSEGALLLEQDFNVDLGSMDIEKRNVFAWRVILKEGFDPVQPGKYRDLPRYERRSGPGTFLAPDFPIPGQLELYEAGKRDKGIMRKKTFNESNFVNTLSRLNAYIKPTFTDVDKRGNVNVNTDIKRLIDSSNTSDNDIGATVIGSGLNGLTKRGEEQISATFFENLISRNPKLRKIVIDRYGDLTSANEANLAGTLDFGVTSRPPSIPVMPTHPATVGEDLAARGKTLGQESFVEEVIKPIPSWWAGQENQMDLTTIERHLSGRVKNRAGYQKALARLGMTDEEARQQFLSPVMAD